MAMKAGTISPTDTNRKLRGLQIRTRAQHSTTNRKVHVTLPLSLARCPFCGEKAQIVEDETAGGYMAECERCLSTGPGGNDQGEAARRWNTRMVLKRRTHGT